MQVIPHHGGKPNRDLNSEAKAGEIRYDDGDVEVFSVQHIYGKGMGSLVHELASNGVDTLHRFRHEDQAGSLVGVTDANGHRTDEYFYLDFGTPVRRAIAFDGNTSRISSVQANTPGAGLTRINLLGTPLTASALVGKQLRAIASLHVGNIDANGTSSIDVQDRYGDLYTALNGGSGFVVLDVEAPATDLYASGVWEDVFYDEIEDETIFLDEGANFTATVSPGDVLKPDVNNPDTWLVVAAVPTSSVLVVLGNVIETAAENDSYEVWEPIWGHGAGASTYTNPNANFEEWMIGWLFTPDVNEPCYLQVIEVVSATSIKVKGDARGLSNPDDHWRIHAPPGVNPTTGALHTDLVDTGSRYLCAQMRYMPPQVGFDVLGTTEGAQGGSHHSGTYYAEEITDPDAGTAFQEGEKTPKSEPKRVKEPRAIRPRRDGGSDTPSGGIVLNKEGCECDLDISITTGDYSKHGWDDKSQQQASVGEAVRYAIEKRKSWLKAKGKSPGPPEGDASEDVKGRMGHWKLTKKNDNGTHSTVGYMVAFAIIISYSCDCILSKPNWAQEEWRLPGEG